MSVLSDSDLENEFLLLEHEKQKIMQKLKHYQHSRKKGSKSKVRKKKNLKDPKISVKKKKRREDYSSDSSSDDEKMVKFKKIRSKRMDDKYHSYRQKYRSVII